MLTFLRKIRKSLIESGSTRKYVLYAIGETTLVVIGILIALQINNWNENRIDRIKEQEMLRLLHEEFLENKMSFQRVIDGSLQQLDTLNWAISIFPVKPKITNIGKIELLLSKSKRAGYFTFNPSNAVINGITNNNSFDLITDKALRSRILSWEGLLQDYLEDVKRLEDHREKIVMPYLIKNGLLSESRRGFSKQNLNFLGSTEFESLVYHTRDLLENVYNPKNHELFPEVKNLQKTIEEIIELTKSK